MYIINKLKVMLSFMVEVSCGTIPKAANYVLTGMEFYDIVDVCQEEGLIRGVRIEKDEFKDIESIYMDNAKITFKGLEYLHKHSDIMKGYKGLKHVKEWLQF